LAAEPSNFFQQVSLHNSLGLITLLTNHNAMARLLLVTSLVIWLLPAFLPAQTAINPKTMNHLKRQQQQWQQKQWPANTVLYQQKYGKMPPTPPVHAYKMKQNTIVMPVYKANRFTAIAMETSQANPAMRLSINPSPNTQALQSFLTLQRAQYAQYKSTAWWKDPKKAEGASMLRSFLGN
jgi:hypothetical protein